VSVSASIGHVSHVDSPRFTVCPSASGSVCDVGILPQGQSDELQATVRVRKAAALGEQIKLAATAKGTGAAAFSASAAAVAVSAAPSPSPSPPAGGTLPPVLPPLPYFGGTSATDPSGLFPTVSPAPSLSPSSGAGIHTRRGSDHFRAATTSATLPLSPRLIGGQLAGLAVLAGAVAMAIARLSLRAPRPQDGKDAPS
jgi:hypothetical protein